MPNYVKNILVVKGTKENVERCLTSISKQHEDGVFSAIDFNKISPMPDEVENTVEDSNTDFYLDCYKASLKNKTDAGIVSVLAMSRNRCFYSRIFEMDEENLSKSIKEGIEKGKKLYDNIVNHGEATWYRWANRFWGTKWNAMSTELIRDDTVVFNTAWSGVPELMTKLSQMNPDVTLLYGYADEDKGGCNCGAMRITNGNIKAVSMFSDMDDEDKSTNESIRFAEKVWDEDVEYITSIISEACIRRFYFLTEFTDGTASINCIACDFDGELDINDAVKIAKDIMDSACKLYNKEPKECRTVSKDAYDAYIKKYGNNGDVRISWDGDNYNVEDNRKESE